MNSNHAAALAAAGRLLQSKTWPGGKVRIDKTEAETYPQAVARVTETLDDSEREKLRGLVVWVLDYERHDRR